MNDPGASECWLCHRLDWSVPPKARSKEAPRGDPRRLFTGCLFVVTIALIAIVGLSFRASRIVGLLAAIAALLVYALAIALYAICMALPVK